MRGRVFYLWSFIIISQQKLLFILFKKCVGIYSHLASWCKSNWKWLSLSLLPIIFTFKFSSILHVLSISFIYLKILSYTYIFFVFLFIYYTLINAIYVRNLNEIYKKLEQFFLGYNTFIWMNLKHLSTTTTGR